LPTKRILPPVSTVGSGPGVGVDGGGTAVAGKGTGVSVAGTGDVVVADRQPVTNDKTKSAARIALFLKDIVSLLSIRNGITP
jgi:hypothetical protein